VVIASAFRTDGRGFESLPYCKAYKHGTAVLWNLIHMVIVGLKTYFCCFISPFNTQTMHIKLFYTQKHAYVYLKTWRDSNPGLLVTEVDVMSTASRRQGGK
jgi:hypothetical protein